MVHVLRAADRAPSKSRTVRFEGTEYGTDISFFAVDNEPGQGPGLHTHPYPETWIVHSGLARIVAGDEVIEAGDDAGEIPHAIAIAVLKRARIDLIDHSAAPPFGHIGLHCLP